MEWPAIFQQYWEIRKIKTFQDFKAITFDNFVDVYFVWYYSFESLQRSYKVFSDVVKSRVILKITSTFFIKSTLLLY